MDDGRQSQSTGPSRPNPPRADNVCLYCRRRKTKCDKRLPSCLQCQKNHVRCVYNDTEGMVVADEFRYLRRRLRNVESLAIPGASKTSRSALPLPGLTYEEPPSYARQTGEHGSFLERLAECSSGSNLSEEVCHLLQSKPGEVYGACQVYFQNVHKWMPVISQKLFYRRMTQFSNTKRADFSLLLLSVCLLIQYPLSDTTQLPLYSIVKSNYWHLNSCMEASTELAQAGLLIACYEHASGLVEASYHTIGLCARMGYWMGLHERRIDSDLAKDSDAWLENAEKCNLWWGIFIRDRCVNIEDAAVGKPFAIERHSIPTYLPLDCGDLDMSFTTLSVTGTVGIFVRVAQACYLLDRAINLHLREMTALDDEMKRLDVDIRRLLEILIEQNDSSLCEYCEASAIVIAALFVLHGQNSPSNSLIKSFDAVRNSPIAATTTSSLALKTAERIVIDVARSFNHCLRKINMISLPPAYCHIIYRAAMELTAFHASTDQVQWFQDLEVLRQASWHYGRRWQIAARHLKSVDQTVEGLLSSQPSTFCSFEPLLNHPCLITLFNE